MVFVLKGEQSQVITPGRPPQKFPKERPYCTSCHAPGHTIETCYKIHGYPPGYKGRPNYALRNTPATVNQTSGISSSLEGTVPSVPPVFDKLQMYQLMAIFAQHLSNADKKGGFHDYTSTSHLSGICLSVLIPRLLNSPSSWIVDSGASRHICSNINAFISLKAVHDSRVTLPNHECIEVQFCGDVQLESTLLLPDVLYIPEFRFNLLTVSSLLSHTTAVISFLYDSFTIQDLITDKMIGKGDEIEGLYGLEAVFPSTGISINQVAASTWHSRLGLLQRFYIAYIVIYPLLLLILTINLPVMSGR